MLRLAVSGPTGSGKTSAVRFIGEHTGVCVVPESLPSELFALFTADPSTYCYALQREIILNRRSAEQACNNSWLVARDRTVSEDLHVFVRMHAAGGWLTSAQCDDLAELADAVQRNCGMPDAFLVLSANNATLRKRIICTGAPSRILGRLDDQVQLYEGWVRHLSAPRVVADTSQMDLLQLRDICDWIVSTVAEACAGRALSNSRWNLKWKI
jgi:deoxyadenosine/deoxycytidine kinase